MKSIFAKLLTIIFVIAFMALSAPQGALAASVTMVTADPSDTIKTVTFTCIGNIDDTDFTFKRHSKGLYLYYVVIESLAADDAVTDNSDVYLKDAGGTDLLRGVGVDELDDSSRNVLDLTFFPPILGTLTLDVDNQAEAAGKFTITLVFVK